MAAAQKKEKAQHGGEESADEVDQAGADKIPHAFDVAHDPRDEGAGAVSVIKGDGEPADVLLHLPAQVGDHALRSFGEQLRKRERGDGLDGSRDKDESRRA